MSAANLPIEWSRPNERREALRRWPDQGNQPKDQESVSGDLLRPKRRERVRGDAAIAIPLRPSQIATQHRRLIAGTFLPNAKVPVLQPRHGSKLDFLTTSQRRTFLYSSRSRTLADRHLRTLITCTKDIQLLHGTM